MKVDKTKWEKSLFKNCVTTIKVKKAIQKNNYLSNGKYPIISQEKEFISGYCNNKKNLNQGLGEVVIFGDHTRILKFIDFDFCVGADGVKVLHPLNFIRAKYLYYFLKWIDIPSNGYSRHFKYLKEITIPYPSVNTQQNITTELDTVQKMIEGYKAQLADLDALAQSIFLDMFGDPITNPKGWKKEYLKTICTKITDGTHNPPKFVNDGIPFIFVSNIVNNEITYKTQKFIDESTYDDLWKSTPIEINDVIYTSVGSYGNPAIVKSNKKFMFQRHIALIKPNHDIIDSQFLKGFLMSPGGKVQADEKAIGVAQKTLNLNAIKNFKIILPPLPLQQQFAERVEAIERQKELLQAQLAEAQTLMAERMQYYFD